MQKSKTYVGSIGSYSSGTTRPVVYGNTATASVSALATDFILNTIADFLKNDCGVDAAYEIREGNAYKWLWIYGLPMLIYVQTTTTSLASSYAPFSSRSTGDCIPASGSNGTIFSSTTTGAYNFTLYYYGNPEDVCVLYVKSNLNSTSTFRLCVLKTTNILTGLPSVTAVGQNSGYPIYTAYDLDENGLLVWNASISSYSRAKSFVNILNLQYTDVSQNSGKLPLVNMVFGVHYCKHAFLTPNSDMLPRGVAIGNPVQTEVTVGGRTFINFLPWGSTDNVNSNSTATYTGGTSYTNLGLVEV